MENFNSSILLQHAIKILKEAPIKEHEWAICGGTVLAYFYRHRLSKDIDIFIQNLQLLSSVSPRFNEQAENSRYFILLLKKEHYQKNWLLFHTDCFHNHNKIP